MVLPDSLSYQKYFYQKDETSGFRPFSLEFLQEMIRGIGQGFGPGFLLGAVPFLLIAAFGFQRFLRRSWPVALSLTFPCLLLAGYLVGRSIPVSPRFFLIAIPVAFMAAVVATWESTDWLAGRRMIPAGQSTSSPLPSWGWWRWPRSSRWRGYTPIRSRTTAGPSGTSRRVAGRISRSSWCTSRSAA